MARRVRKFGRSIVARSGWAEPPADEVKVRAARWPEAVAHTNPRRGPWDASRHSERPWREVNAWAAQSPVVWIVSRRFSPSWASAVPEAANKVQNESKRAAKAALMSFTRSMAADFAPRGIRVNALAPGTVDTDMVRNTGPESAARMAAASHMGRAAHVDEMVGPVIFLASDAASFVTGQVLLADGGMVPH